MKPLSITTTRSAVSLLLAICVLFMPNVGVGVSLAQPSWEAPSDFFEFNNDDDDVIDAAPETFDIDLSGIGDDAERTSDDSRSSASERPSLEPRYSPDYSSTAAESSADADRKPFPLKLTLQISSGALAAGGLIGGLVYNGKVSDTSDKYKVADNPADAKRHGDAMEDYAGKRNLMYILMGVGLAGFSVTFLF